MKTSEIEQKLREIVHAPEHSVYVEDHPNQEVLIVTDSQFCWMVRRSQAVSWINEDHNFGDEDYNAWSCFCNDVGVVEDLQAAVEASLEKGQLLPLMDMDYPEKVEDMLNAIFDGESFDALGNYKSHELVDYVKAITGQDEEIWLFDSATSGNDDALIYQAGTDESEIQADLLAHFELEEWPAEWSLTLYE